MAKKISILSGVLDMAKYVIELENSFIIPYGFVYISAILVSKFWYIGIRDVWTQMLEVQNADVLEIWKTELSLCDNNEPKSENTYLLDFRRHAHKT